MKTLFALASATLLLACAGRVAPENGGTKDAIVATFSAGEAGCREFVVKSYPTAEAKLNALFQLMWDQGILESPEGATYLGDARGQDKLTDMSMDAIERRKRLTVCYRDAIKSINPARLDKPTDRLNYQLALRGIERDIEGQKYPDEFFVVDQMGGPHQGLPQLLLSMRTATEKDFLDRIARLDAAPEWIMQSTQLLQAGLAKGITPPRATLVSLPKQMDSLLSTDMKNNPLMQSFDDMPSSIAKDRQAQIKERAWNVIRTRVIPAFKTFREFVAGPYLKGAREPIAFSLIPNGIEWYAYNVREHTTTDLTPEQIHEIGLKEVARLNLEMDRAMRDAKFSGDRQEFFQFLRSDPRFFYKTANELLTGYRDIAKRADPQLTKMFVRVPRVQYGIKEMPSASAPDGPTAYYEGGSVESGRPGWFVANTSKLNARPKWEMEALTLHEAVPGHHFQISLAQELTDLPPFRRHAGYTAFTEGWGLYAESLGEDMGFYKDPYSRVGRITYEMWRASRLVVDTGIHAKGWSRQKAIEFMAAQMPKPREDITAEVDRYIVWPGQATAYKIGELKFQELRKRARQKLGAKFDLRRFHDVLLANGALPMDVLEKMVDEWIALEDNR